MAPGPPQQVPGRGVTEQQQEATHHRLEDEDVARPEEGDVGDSEEQQDREPPQESGLESNPLRASVAHLDRESEPEEEREQREELRFDEEDDRPKNEAISNLPLIAEPWRTPRAP